MTFATEPEGLVIGAVAQLVGVPPETLRTWERRYGLPSPARGEGGRRLYSPEEVRLLHNVAELARQGERVRDLARMRPEALEARVSLHRAALGEGGTPERLRVGLVHPSWTMELGGLAPSGLRLEVVPAASLEVLAEELALDALVIHLDRMPEWSALDQAQERLDVGTVIVLASYLPRPTREALLARGVRVLDPSARLSALRQAIEDAVLADSRASTRPAAPPPEGPRFTRAQLEAVLNAPSGVRCECPAHLAALTLRLRDFERYSQQCEQDSPEDEALHRDLAAGAREAAAVLEGLLERLCARERVAV